MSSQSTILTIDIGLTNCKVSLFNLEGEMLAQETRRYPTLIERPDWSEQDPNNWWKAVIDSVHALNTNSKSDQRNILVIGVTAHMHGMIAIDQDNQPITNCWTLFDRRSGEEADTINRTLGNTTTFKLTG